MKKILSLFTAVLLAAALTGCGNSPADNSAVAPTDSTSNSSESSDVDKSEEEEKIVVDPFENISYSFTEESIYPDDFEIVFDASNTPFGKDMEFTYFVESANRDGIIIKARANVDDIDDILEENNYVVEETEKTFTILTDEIASILLSPEQITEENKEIVINEMKSEIFSCIERDVNIQSIESDVNIQKLYLTIPKEDTQFEPYKRKKDSDISLDENSFEDKYVNICTLEFSGYFQDYAIGTFTDSNNNYYAAALYPIFEKNIITETTNKHTASDTIEYGWTCAFSDEISAYKGVLYEIFYTYDIEKIQQQLEIKQLEIVEIPLD